MKRPAYGLLVGVAVLTGLVAVVASQIIDRPLHDPDGFLGPAWVRLPAMVLGAFLIDVVPRSVWRAPHRLKATLSEAPLLVSEHRTRERIAPVAIGRTSFFENYVR